MIRVLLADDHAAVRAGLGMILGNASDMEVIGEAADGGTAVSMTRTLRPDVVLMDIRMPGVDGIEATAAIATEGLARVLVLTTFDIDDYVFGALRAGAAGFVLKSIEPADLMEAVRRVAAGDGVLNPEITRKVLERFSAQASPAGQAGSGPTSLTEPLTAREAEVLAALGEGLSNQQIGRRLHIAETTVKTHVSRVLAKLHLASRVQAAIYWQENPGPEGRH